MTQIDRRAMIAASGAALLLPSTLHAQGLTGNRPTPFSWDRLVAHAQQLTRTPFKETPAHPGAAKVDYIAQHEARFRDDRTLWGDLPGDTGIRFFPLSQYSTQPVSIATVENGRATPLRYDADMFDAPAGNAVKALGPNAGFAGFRIMNAARDGDWLSFLGASYFRAPSPQKQFGLSARAIAINTSLGKEEFPRFTHFWLERTGESSVTIYALLDGASVTGAYRFVSRLGADGVTQDVTAALFPRRPIEELGLMAMTSMFWYDQANRGKGTDWRPEIHDSDILSIASANGTAHARPIINPPTPLVSAFAERDPKGFPTLWAAPSAPLGAGEVRLYSFPTDSEYTDNVVAYWTPSAPATPGQRIDASYRVDWSAARAPASEALGNEVAIVQNVWRGRGDEEGSDRLVIDFAGVTDGAKPEIWTDISAGTMIKTAGYPVLGQPGLYRMVLDLKREGAGLTDIRAQLRLGDRAISEYVHYPVGP